MRISVIVTTYNRPDALALVLDGLLDQTDPDYEIIVADDGSGAPTKEVVQTRQARSRVPLLHVWQPDEGFRAAAVRNLGVLAASGDYIVFLDGDCIPRPGFVANHRRLAEAGYLVSGSRVLLDKDLSAELAAHAQAAPAPQRWPLWRWLWLRLSGRSNKFFPLIGLPDHPWRRHKSVRWRRIKSCNLAVWKSDLIKVNGFDEVFVGWGHEDADLVLRLANAGLGRKSGAFATEVLHLWHKENGRGAEEANRRRVELRQTDGTVRAESGLAEHGAA
ncbi:MAG: glycosyltransferase family 2 protein [Candidatus Protistobacter heckmanni]|nr:glycosyltransferase family 2 protein [Candidatus Protistobacter heckmanni]